MAGFLPQNEGLESASESDQDEIIEISSDEGEEEVSQSPEFNREFVRQLLNFICNRMEQPKNVSHLSTYLKTLF